MKKVVLGNTKGKKYTSTLYGKRFIDLTQEEKDYLLQILLRKFSLLTDGGTVSSDILKEK